MGATLSFVLGRYLLRDFAKGLLSGKLGVLDRKPEKHGFSIFFYLRILWFPFIVLNYGAGATRIRFGDYFWGTFLGTMPSIVIASYFFGSLKDIIASYNRPADLLQFNILFPAGLLGLSFFLPGIVRRIRGGPLPDAAPPEETERRGPGAPPPALSGAAPIAATVRSVRGAGADEVIVVDGGSEDGTSDAARPVADVVVSSPPGRARPMNAGARAAKGAILLFLHADTTMLNGSIASIRPAVEQEGFPGGAFRVRLAVSPPAPPVAGGRLCLPPR